MSIRTILVGASGGSATDGALDVACQLAGRFQAHVECLHIRPDPEELMMTAGAAFGMPLPGTWIEKVSLDGERGAAKIKSAFVTAATRHALAVADSPQLGASASWREERGHAPGTLSERARFFDLVVLGRSERVIGRPYTDTVEQTLLHSGRPVLLAPARTPPKLGETIALGWNGSPQAVRVLKASLPLLRRAQAVLVIVVGPKHRPSASGVQEHLAWHGIDTKVREIPVVEGVGPGAQLLSAARDAGADLLALGGYGHTPWHEMLLGGATREIVGVSLLPLLISH
jgi:nucleotide-binding universal stress UspA family protein